MGAAWERHAMCESASRGSVDPRAIVRPEGTELAIFRLSSAVPQPTTLLRTPLGILDTHPIVVYKFVCFCATAPSQPEPPHSRSFKITHNDAPQSIGLLWTSDQLVAVTSTWQHTTHNRHATIPPIGLEPTTSAGERPQTYVLDHAATGTGDYEFSGEKNFGWPSGEMVCFLFGKIPTVDTYVFVYDVTWLLN